GPKRTRKPMSRWSPLPPMIPMRMNRNAPWVPAASLRRGPRMTHGTACPRYAAPPLSAAANMTASPFPKRRKKWPRVFVARNCACSKAATFSCCRIAPPFPLWWSFSAATIEVRHDVTLALDFPPDDAPPVDAGRSLCSSRSRHRPCRRPRAEHHSLGFTCQSRCRLCGPDFEHPRFEYVGGHNLLSERHDRRL